MPCLPSIADLLTPLAAKMAEEPFKLLIMDSITANLRVDFSGRGELAERCACVATCSALCQWQGVAMQLSCLACPFTPTWAQPYVQAAEAGPADESIEEGGRRVMDVSQCPPLVPFNRLHLLASDKLVGKQGCLLCHVFRRGRSCRPCNASRALNADQGLDVCTQISEEFNVAVVITNQVMSDPSGGAIFVSDPTKPVRAAAPFRLFQ